MSDLPIYERIPASVQEALGHKEDNDFAIAMSNLVYARESTVGFDALTEPERVIFCLDKLEQEVNNGGFEQYFRNSSGDSAFAAPAALRALGAPQVAALVEKAMALFPRQQPSRNRDEREKQMDAWGSREQDTLGQLTDAFLDYPEPLSQLERAYVRKNEASFPVPPGAGKSISSL